MNIKKSLSAALSAILLCGCGRVVPAQVVLTETEISVTETQAAVTMPVPEEEVFQTEASEISAPLSEDEAQEKVHYDFPEEFYAGLEEIIEEYPHFQYYDISLAYMDFETGFTFMIGPDKHYYYASVMKAPYMLYIYRLALAGKADLGQKLTYTEEFEREGTGVLKDMEFDTEFTVEELIGFCLEESDNAAFAMLRELYPEDGYTDFMKALGVEHGDDHKAFGHPQICCETALILSKAIYAFIMEGNPYSDNLKYHMTHSRNAMIVGGTDAEVVRKYGWYDGYFHDMAVILDENGDYALSIMTNLDMLEIDTREYHIFRDLSGLIAEYSCQLTEADDPVGPAIINIERQEVEEMALPKDPYMLLSVLNMKLRDVYADVDALCEDMEADFSEISAAMEKLGYEYSGEANQFIPIERGSAETEES